MTKLYTRDFTWLLFAVVLAPAMTYGLSIPLDQAKDRHTLLFLATLLAFFSGIFPSIEMMLTERAIYERERMVNLKIPSYLFSKLVFLLCFGIFQAFSITAVVVWIIKADAPFAPCFVLLLTVQATGSAAGLFFSTLSKSTKVALSLMLMWVVLMLAFSGFLVKLPSLRDSGTEWILAPSSMRWGLGGLIELDREVPQWVVEKFGFGDEVWHLNAIVNVLLSIFPTMATMLFLRLRDRV